MLIIPKGVSFRFYSTLEDLAGNPVPLADVQSVVIKLKPPTGAVWEGPDLNLTATVEDADAGKIYADATAGHFVVLGDWSAWAVATWADGRVVKSYGLKFRVVEEGTPVSGAC